MVFNSLSCFVCLFFFCRLQQKFTREAVQLVLEIRDREHMNLLGYSSTMTPPLTPCKLPCINAIGSYIYNYSILPTHINIAYEAYTYYSAAMQ